MNPTMEDLNTMIMKLEHTTDIPSTSRSMTEPNLPCGDLVEGSREDYFNICVPLYRASITGDWATAKLILEQRRELVRFAITQGYATALHVAVSAEENKLTEDFVQNLVDWMRDEDLELTDLSGKTALCLAAKAGNIKMAKIMVNRNNHLPSIPGISGRLPLYYGAAHGRHNMVKYLYDVSQSLTGDCWTPQNRSQLLSRCVESDLFDVALKIVTDWPKLASNVSVLEALARKAYALNRVERRNFWRIINLILRIIHMKVGPVEKNTNALELLRIIWSHTIRTMPWNEVAYILVGPPFYEDDRKQGYPSRILFAAAEMGNTRFVVELLQAYPDLIWQINEDKRTIFHIAVMHRHQGIYNLLYEIGAMKDVIITFTDTDDNNMLHLIGMTSVKMRPQESGASLLMQRELLWFKEVEMMLPPITRGSKNKFGQTPYQLFSQENKDLFSQGLKWMKDCMVIATLIVTISFAVAFTVPGGYNQDHGFPIFIHERTFLAFVIADAISLFSSSTLHLMFLFILTSRYNQRDYLYSLPRMLMMGLSTLLISVVAMMVTFSASFFVLYRNGLKWVPILIAVFAAMPVIVFAGLQYPLLVDMYNSLYDSRYLFKPRKRMLYNTNPRV